MTSKHNQVIGEVLRELRQELGLTQDDLSVRCGRHRTYVSLVERGEHSPTLDTIFVLAEGLEVEPSEILASVEERLDR